MDESKGQESPTPAVKKFVWLAQTQEEEDAFDIAAARNVSKPVGAVASVAHLVKGGLGAGILSAHVALMKAGFGTGVVLNLCFGMYIGYCLHILVRSAQTLYRRTKIPYMTYPDLGEAACACFPNPKVQRWSKCFRHWIDVIICIDLFGSCSTYQIIIAKTLKQLVENRAEISLEGIPGYPGLREYLELMVIPIILVCLITQLKWLAPVSYVGNLIIVCVIIMTVLYAYQYNPTFSNMTLYTDLYHQFEYIGIAVFSMSCVGVVLPIENNMANPKRFPPVLFVGMIIIVSFSFLTAFFGYVAFLDKCESPITVNFPMDMINKVLKGLIAFMVLSTHAINFWVPFNICFHYIKGHHNQNHLLRWELFYRALFVTIIAIVAITFPTINALIGFLGTFCLSNMAFIWPNIIELLTVWHRPGLGKLKWRLWKSIILLGIGLFCFVCGSIVNSIELISIFFK